MGKSSEERIGVCFEIYIVQDGQPCVSIEANQYYYKDDVRFTIARDKDVSLQETADLLAAVAASIYRVAKGEIIVDYDSDEDA